MTRSLNISTPISMSQSSSTPMGLPLYQRPPLLHASQRPYKRPHAAVNSDSETEEEEDEKSQQRDSSKKRRTDAGLQGFSALSLQPQQQHSQPPSCAPEIHPVPGPSSQEPTLQNEFAYTASAGMDEDDFDMDDREEPDEESPDFQELQQDQQQSPAFTLHSDIQARFNELEAARRGIKPLPIRDALPRIPPSPSSASHQAPSASGEPWGQLVLYRPLNFKPPEQQEDPTSSSPTSPALKTAENGTEDPGMELD